VSELRPIERPNVVAATWALFTSVDRFTEFLFQDNKYWATFVAIAEQQRRSGARPHHSSEAGRRLDAIESMELLRRTFGHSMLIALAMSCTALALAWVTGAVHASLPWHWGKVLQGVGGALALWGTIAALTGPPKSLGGCSLAETVHAFAFTVLLAIGGGAAMVGMLISA
jgi:hypothetical protein